MPTKHQEKGDFGEKQVTRNCNCPRCKRPKTLVRLPRNFKCADVICDFCGFLGQVKTTDVRDINKVPNQILGAAWGPQDKRMAVGIYFPLFLVLKNKETGQYAIHYLASDLQTPEMFVRRKKLKETARRAGWEGFYYNLKNVQSRFVCIFSSINPDTEKPS